MTIKALFFLIAIALFAKTDYKTFRIFVSIVAFAQNPNALDGA